MANANPDRFQLPLRTLSYVLPPIVVISAASYLINNHGFPLDHLANATVQNGHAEAAARLRTLAAWLLLACTGIACIIYCAWSASAFERTTVGRLAAAYLVLAAGGVALVAGGGVEGGQRLVDRRVICAAFDLIESAATPAPASASAAGGPEATRAGGRAAADPPPALLKTYGLPRPKVVDDAGACGPASTSYPRMWWLNQIQKYILVLLIPALVLGTISCRALPEAPNEEDCRYQVGRLKTHLYLTAAALVSGLLFLSALIHWPGFAFEGDAAAAYKAHVDAYIFYWGVGYSLLIASCYIPVAIDLTRACEGVPTARPGSKRKGGAEVGGDEDAGATPVGELFSLLKTLAALFAPAIAGLLGGVLNI